MFCKEKNYCYSLKLTDLVLVREYTRFRYGQYEDVCAHYRRWPRSKSK